MAHQQLFRVDRPVTLRGTEYQPGQVIDLAPMGLPPGRAQQLVDQRRGELLSSADVVQPPSAAEPAAPTPVADVSEGTFVREDDRLQIEGELSEPVADSRDEFESMTRSELIAACRQAGMPTSGSKADMIARLTSL